MKASKAINIGLVSVLSILGSTAQLAAQGSPHKGRIHPHYGNLPLVFEANQGQTDARANFLSRSSGYSVFLTGSGMTLGLRPSAPGALNPRAASLAGKLSKISQIRQYESLVKNQRAGSISIRFVGAAANPQYVGENPLSTKVNYFIGRDPSKWRRNIPTFGKVRYRNVYPGIDLVYYGNNRKLEYDFVLAAGADPSRIQFEVKGSDSLNVDANGNLLLTKGGTKLLLQTPVVYQQSNGMQKRVSGSYVLRGSTHVGFNVGAYDATKPLVIDPVLVYSTYLGGSADDFATGVAVDSAGEAYLVGITDSPDFPAGQLGENGGGGQFTMFLTKVASDGSSLLWLDYFGSATGNNAPSAIALDSTGNAYVTGDVEASDFPAVNAYQSALAGSQDAFLTAFSADGASIQYSTYLGGAALTDFGGSTAQYGTSVAVDESTPGSPLAIVAGVTAATDFPTTGGQTSVSPDQFGDLGIYGFVTKFSTDGKNLVYSTYLAGNTLNTAACSGCFPDSEIAGVAADSFGDAYVTGFTSTNNFPTTNSAFDTAYPGSGVDDVGFVSKIDLAGALVYSTYLGGEDSSYLEAIAVDSGGSAYVTGYDTADDNFPVVTTTICDPGVSACNGAVIAKLSPSGNSLVYSTFIGTANNMAGQAIQVDTNGNAFIVGSDTGLNLTNQIEGYSGSGDVVVAEVAPNASSLEMATFLGGQGLDIASAMALDSNGAVYVTGVTQSADFPTTSGVAQNAFGGSFDAFLSKIDPNTPGAAVAFGPYQLDLGSVVQGSTSAALTTILRNMGSVALTITGWTINTSTPSNNDFAETDDCGGTLNPASFCTVSITFTPSVTGPITGSLVLTDSANGSPHSVSLSGTGLPSGADFVASTPDSSATVAAGQTATYQLTVSPSGGAVNQPISFACENVPAWATCTVNPASLNLGSDSQSVTVSVKTAGASAAAPGYLGSSARPTAGPAVLLVFLTLLGFVTISRRRVRTFAGASAFLLCLAAVGCGGKGSSPIVASPGTYTINVVATAGSLRHVTPLTLVVK